MNGEGGTLGEIGEGDSAPLHFFAKTDKKLFDLHDYTALAVTLSRSNIQIDLNLYYLQVVLMARGPESDQSHYRCLLPLALDPIYTHICKQQM